MLGCIAGNIEGCQPEDGELIADLFVSLVGRIAHESRPDGRAGRDARMEHRMHEWARSVVGDPTLSPERLGKEFGLSRRGLYRRFELMGITPSRWLWNVRLECADERLRQTGASVSEVAYSVGFNDSGHFSRLYKRRFGMPPAMRRKRG